MPRAGTEVAHAAAVQAGADELRERGFTLPYEARLEPWGQTVARLRSAGHVTVGLSFAQWMHGGGQPGRG